MKISEMPDPENLKRVRAKRGSVILAEGEVTGHAHRIASSRAALFEAGDERRFLKIRGRTQLQHDEHDAIDLDPGIYEVIRQREYTGDGDYSIIGD